MINAYSKYGAVATKLRAMHARCLTDSDWETLGTLRSLPAVVTFLKRHPGWEPYLANAPSTITRGELEAMLDGAFENDFAKLYKFASSKDRLLLRFVVYQNEYRAILARMRTLYSPGISAATQSRVPESIRALSKLNYQALSVADSWRAIVAATADTIYYQPLRSLQLNSNSDLPDYTSVGMLVQDKYYEMLLKFIKSSYRGKIRALLLESAGQEIDLLNLTHVIRMKSFFSSSPQKPQNMIFSVTYKLRRDFLDKIIAAPSRETIFELIKSTHYGKFFTSNSFETIDEYYRQARYEFNLKQMRQAPSPYIFVAYMALKQHEISRLNSHIEKAFYAAADLLRKA